MKIARRKYFLIPLNQDIDVTTSIYIQPLSVSGMKVAGIREVLQRDHMKVPLQIIMHQNILFRITVKYIFHPRWLSLVGQVMASPQLSTLC